MSGWTDGWMDGRIDGWMDGWWDGWMDRQDEWMDGCTHIKLCTFLSVTLIMFSSTKYSAIDRFFLLSRKCGKSPNDVINYPMLIIGTYI